MVPGGDNMIYATDDAVSAATMTVSGGNTWVMSDDKEAVDVDGIFGISRGTLIAAADSGNAAGLDSPEIVVRGGNLVCTGGGVSEPREASQGWISTTIKNATLNETIAIAFGERILMCYLLPRDMASMSLLYSSEELPAGAEVTLMRGGKVTHYGTEWSGLFSAGSIYEGVTSATNLKAK